MKIRSIREDDLAYIIGEWYLKWKSDIIVWDSLTLTHKLGFAKEDLKKMIDKKLTIIENHGRKKE